MLSRFVLVLAAVVAVVGMNFLSPARADALALGPDVISLWSFDEGGGTAVADSGPGGNNGSITGAVGFATDPVRGSVLDFTGASGKVVVPHSPSLEPAYGGMSALIKIDHYMNADVISKTTNYWVNTGVSGGFSVYGLRITEAGAVYGFVGNNDPATPGAPWRYARTADGVLSLNTWHEVAFTWNGSTVDVFVDSLRLDSTPYAPVPGIGLSYSSATNLTFGSATSWGTAYPGDKEYLGLLDEVKLWRVNPVPEPGTLLLLGSGLAGLGLARRRLRAR